MAKTIRFVALEPRPNAQLNLARLRRLGRRAEAEHVCPVADPDRRETQWDFANGDRFVYAWGGSIRKFNVRERNDA